MGWMLIKQITVKADDQLRLIQLPLRTECLPKGKLGALLGRVAIQGFIAGPCCLGEAGFELFFQSSNSFGRCRFTEDGKAFALRCIEVRKMLGCKIGECFPARLGTGFHANATAFRVVKFKDRSLCQGTGGTVAHRVQRIAFNLDGSAVILAYQQSGGDTAEVHAGGIALGDTWDAPIRPWGKGCDFFFGITTTTGQRHTRQCHGCTHELDEATAGHAQQLIRIVLDKLVVELLLEFGRVGEFV